MDHSGISLTNRYDIFRNNFDKNIHITLRGLKESYYEIKEYTLSRTHGSAFDTWVEMGAPEHLTNAETEYLMDKSIPLFRKIVEFIADTYSI